MKYLLITALNFIMIGSHFAQSNIANNYDFENTLTGCDDCEFPQCVPFWSSSHGTPQVTTDGSNKQVALWSQEPGIGEGIYQRIIFIPGMEYKIRLKARTTTLGDPINDDHGTFVVALTTSVGYQCGSFQRPSINFMQQVAQETVYNTSWTTYEFDIGPLANGYSQLWIYASNVDNTDVTQWLNIDDVEVLYDCPENVYYQNTTSLPFRTKRSDFIVAGKAVTSGTNGDVQVLSGQQVFFEAGNQILLKDGFSALTGADS